MANKYVNDNRLQQSLEAVRDRLVIKTSTEAQALIQSVQYPSCVYYTSDTHCVVVNGNVYGRGDINFSAIQVVTTEPQSQWDTNKLVMVYSGNDTMGMFAYNGSQWANIGEYTLSIELTADAVSYDDTTTQLGAGNVQDAIEVLKDDVLGDDSYYWKDVLREEGVGVALANNFYIRKTQTTTGGKTYYPGDPYTSGSYQIFFFDVKAGQKLKVEGLTSASGTFAYAFYNESIAESELGNGMNNSTTQKTTDDTLIWDLLLDLHNHLISGDGGTTTNYNYSEEVTVPTGAKMMGVSFVYSGTHAKVPGDDMNIYRWEKKEGVTIADRKGMLIDGWAEKSIPVNYVSVSDFTTIYYHSNYNTLELEIGDKMPILINDGLLINSGMATSGKNIIVMITLGCRSKLLKVKEGDKLLLDTFSPLYYGLVFTDEDYIITSIIDDSRLNGVYTAPNDGYAIIVDTLHRDNYVYDKAVANLAYIALDARNSGAIQRDDYCNELAPYYVDSYDIDYTPTSTGIIDFRMPYYNLTSDNGKYMLIMLKVTLGANYDLNAGNYNFQISNNGSSATTITAPTIPIATAQQKGTFWVYYIGVENFQCYYNDIRLRLTNGHTANKRIDMTIDKMFVHTFDDASETKQVAKKIDSGELVVDDSGTLQEIDKVASAIGMASVSTLGYDILARGATLPIDNDGVAYGMTLKGLAGRTFNGTSSADNGDKDLVYLPIMDWSAFTGTQHHVFNGCENLVTIPDIEWNSGLIFGNYAFRYCSSLKMVGDIPCNGYAAFQECNALEKVGNITKDSNNPNMSNMFDACYSLKEVGTISGTDAITNMSFLFRNCLVIERVPNLDTSSVTNMAGMFQYCAKLKYPPVLSTTENVTAMQNMFQECKSLEQLPVFDDTSKVDNFGYLCSGCMSLKTVGNLDVSKTTTLTMLFNNCRSLESVGSIVVPSTCTNVSNMFANCRSLTSINLSGDFSHVTTGNAIFSNCFVLEEINTTLNLSSCTNLSNLFASCKALRRVAGLDLSAVTSMSSWFTGCSSLEELTLTNLGKSTATSYDFSALSKWGTTTAGHDTLYASLYTNSDPSRNITVKLSTASYNALTQAEIDNITSKGITLTH